MTMPSFWIVLGSVALLFVATSAVVVVQRRRAARESSTPDSVMRNARRAMAEMQDQRRRASKGTIRGKGGGGYTQTTYDAGHGSDTYAGA